MTSTWTSADLMMVALAGVGLLFVSRGVAEVLGARHPVNLFVLFWATILVLPPILGIPIYVRGDLATGIIVLGVLSVVGGALLGTRVAAVEGLSDEGKPRLSRARLVLVLAATSAFLVAGYFDFRSQIEEAMGADFATLDTRQIRYAQNYMELEGGVLGVGFGLGAVVVALAIWGGRQSSRWFYLVVPAALWAVAQSPARTYLLSVAVVGVVFWFYTSTDSGGDKPIKRGRLALVALAALGAGAVYFAVLGEALGKQFVAGGEGVIRYLPPGLQNLLLYFLGGPSALSTALESEFNPSSESHGRTMYLPYRLLAVFDERVQVPETIAEAIRIPTPFNLYTAQGDVWFDYGFAGVIFVFTALGFWCAVAHERAVSGDASAMFVSAVLCAVLAATPLNLSIGTVSTASVLLVGWACFRFLTSIVHGGVSDAWGR